MDGIHMEVNTPLTGVASMNKHDASHESLSKVATHQVASALLWQLFILLVDMLVRAMCTQQFLGLAFLAQHPPLHMEASNIVPSHDGSFITYIQPLK
jgi:hypothetical protein